MALSASEVQSKSIGSLFNKEDFIPFSILLSYLGIFHH